MTASALIVLILAILVLWGGLAASLVALRMSPERVTYPPGLTRATCLSARFLGR